MDGSILFARWRQCAPYVIHALFGFHNPNGISIRSAILHSSQQNVVGHMPGACPFRENCPWHKATWTHIYCMVPWAHTRVHTLYGIAIGSVVYARLCTVAKNGRFNRIRQVAPMCNPCNTCFLGPPESTDRPTYHATRSIGSISTYGVRSTAIRPNNTDGDGVGVWHAANESIEFYVNNLGLLLLSGK